VAKQTTAEQDVKTRKVTLTGIAPIMFDRYAGDNKTELPVEAKMYYAADGKTLILPAANVVSLLTAQNTPSAPKRFCGKSWTGVAQAILSYTAITPFEIPLTSDGKPIVFKGFGDQITIHKSVARLAKGIPNPKVRPVVGLPWELSFELSMYPNTDVSEDLLQSLLVRAGLAIGLGTYRGVYGKFRITQWA